MVQLEFGLTIWKQFIIVVVSILYFDSSTLLEIDLLLALVYNERTRRERNRFAASL